jgi:hypothetical protein
MSRPGYATTPSPRPVGLVLVASDAAVNIFGLAIRYTARAWLPQVESSAEEVARELDFPCGGNHGYPWPSPALDRTPRRGHTSYRGWVAVGVPELGC